MRLGAGLLLLLATVALPARGQVTQLLLPAATAPGAAARAPSAPGDLRSRGTPVRVNTDALFTLPPAAAVELTLPGGARHRYVGEVTRDHGGGIRTWIGRHRDHGNLHRAMVTSGPAGSFGLFSTPAGEFRVVPGAGGDVLIDMDAETANLPQPSLRDDARIFPGAKAATASSAPSAFAPRAGVDLLAGAKSAPAPSYDVDLMVVYTRGVARHLQGALVTRLFFLVERMNAILADSEVALRIRMVNALMVDYPDGNSSETALNAITPGTFFFDTAAFGDVERQREASGADAVFLWQDGPEFVWSTGSGWLGSSPPYAGSMYHTVKGCILGCEWIPLHELGHNMGVHHDHATVAWQYGGTSTYYTGPYRYGTGYAFCTSGTLTCNPEVPNGSTGGCFGEPECTSAYTSGNFADLMAYFSGSAYRNERFSNPNISCVGFDGSTGPCGTPETAARPANAALALNNLRAGISAVKPTRVTEPPGALQFAAANFNAREANGAVTLSVRRVGGSRGALQVSYRTRDASALAGLDYAASTGTLSWADGDLADKSFVIPIVDDGADEPPENFVVELYDAGGVPGVFLGYPNEAVVHISGNWPPGNALPAGYSTGAGSAPWEVTTETAYEGSFGMRSARVFATPSGVSTDLFFTGDFVDGRLSFPLRVSTRLPPDSRFQLMVDGLLVHETGGVFDWQLLSWPIAAGRHTLIWRYINNSSFPCDSCADRVWLDDVALPLALPQASVTLASSPNPSALGADVTLTARVTGASGTPGGMVSLRDGSTPMAACARVPIQADGTAVCVTNTLAAGVHAVSAVYSGNVAYRGGTFGSVTHSVSAGNSAPAITSAATATFTIGTAASFTVTATGTPAPALSLAGTLPPGVTFTASSGVLSGTPVLGSAGSYGLGVRAGNGVSPDATQAFTLVIAEGAQTATAIPTYESAGLYWPNPGANAQDGCSVRFRRSGETTWTQGLALWFDAARSECRGSLVHLAPDTAYEAQLGLPGQPSARALSFRTWANQKPVATTVSVPSGTATLDVTQGGGPGGYVVYQGAPGAVLDAGNAAQFNVTVNASYVIVRGLTLRGAQRDAIRIAPGVTDVVIEDNDISGWGRQRAGTLGIDMDAAVRALCSSPTLERVTIQRNRIHEPRYGANSWSDGHPEGPQAIAFSNCGGNHVIRHNEIWSTPGRYYNDIIGGEDNFSGVGFPNRDSDIYGNRLSHAWDDAIEAEGGNRNVRVWGNYIDQTAVGVAAALTSVGPFYAFRNVYNRNRELEKATLDGDARQEILKAGSDPAFSDGRIYFFHNTTLQAVQAGATRPLGVQFGISGSSPSQPFNNTHSRNNIFHTWQDAEILHRQAGSNNEFAHDLYNGVANVPVVNGLHAAPTYAPGNGWQDEDGGRYALAPGTPGHDGGMRIANFNDDFLGAAPDVGASESGAPPMRFGLAASPGSSVSATPGADLAVTQSASANPAATGKDVMFTVAASNAGPSPASGVSVVDTLPPGWTFVWASPGCAHSAGTVTCTAGTLANGAGTTFKVVARASAAGSATNTVTITGAQFDASNGNNASSVTVGVNASPPGTPAIRYRLYSPVTQEHLFTTDRNEYDTLGAHPETWTQEGQAGKVLDNPGSFNGVTAVPYYRLYNTASRWHHWTTDANEYYTLIQGPPFNAEGVDGYLLPTNTTGATQLYRLLYPDGRGLHHWTIDATEYNILIAQYGWIGEGGSGFVIQ